MFEMIRRVFKIAGNSRGKIVAGIVCNILKSFFNGFMMFGVFWVLLHLDNLTPTIIGQAFCVILGSVLGCFFFQWMYDRTMSGSGYDIFRDYRLEIGDRLKQAPMGYFSEQNLGTIQAMLTTTIADLEGYSMLAIEQMTSGVAMAVLMSVMMFFFSPVIAGLSLVGLALGMLVLRWVRLRAAQYAPIYQEAQEHLVGKVMEYIRGISVLRSFSKGEEGQVEVRAAFQKKWDADYGQEKATAGVLRFYGLTFKLMSCVLIAAAALLYLAGQISLPYCLTFLFCAFTVYSDLEMMGNSAFLSKKINTELDRLEEVTDIPKMDTSSEKLVVSHYGIELDDHRAEQAQQQLYRVGFGSFFGSNISPGAFHAVFLNPPYLSVLSENGGRSRDEKRFLIESIPLLMMGGLLIYIVPYYRLTADLCGIICDNFEQVRIHRFLDREFKQFKQVVVTGVRRRRTEAEQDAEALCSAAEHPETLPTADLLPKACYELPAVSKKVETFRGAVFNEDELARQLANSTGFDRLFAKSRLDSEIKRPPLPLSIGQVGLIGGSGLINGLMECDYPHIVKGRIIKEKHTVTDENRGPHGRLISTEIRETISNRMIFNILTPSGFRSLT